MSQFINQLTALLGAKAVLTQRSDTDSYLQESRGHFRSQALAVVLPASTEQVADTVKLCAKHKVGVVPQGGNTGRVGGASVDADYGEQIVLNLARMNRVLNVDPLNFTMDVQAGCILANIQQAAADNNRLFPLRLGAEGSCQIGGNLASNAGGINALRYGSARDLVLGLEVVTASGEIWHGMNRLRKNNAGYPLKEWFLGTEGSLGIITSAVLKMFPQPLGTATALAGLSSLTDALKVLAAVRERCGDNLTACEVICRRGIEFASQHIERCRDPFDNHHCWYLLLEIDGQQSDEQLAENLGEVLGQCQQQGLLGDAALAMNGRQRDDFWALREGVVEAQRHEGASIKHDISLPLTEVPAFVDEAIAAIEQAVPGIRPCPFGHLGDGNLHFNLSQPTGVSSEEFFQHQPALNRLVHNLVAERSGSFAAEHGVGRIKRDELKQRSGGVALNIMHDIKHALDPNNLMNPGKVLPSRNSSSR